MSKSKREKKTPIRVSGVDELWTSALLDNYCYQYFYKRLSMLAMTCFKWNNLPKDIDERFLELTLFSQGFALFFRDNELGGFLGLTAMLGGRFDVYRIPISRTAYSSNGYQRQLNKRNSVIIFNDYLHTNMQPDVEHFAMRLYNIQRTIDVNLNAQKTPVMILCGENERLSMENLYKQYDGNTPFIFGTSDLDLNKITVLKTDAPFLADKLEEMKTAVWNEYLTYLGISNIAINKKERLLTDEVHRSLGGVISSRYGRLEMRRQACEEINRKFDLNISVEYREDIDIKSYKESIISVNTSNQLRNHIEQAQQNMEVTNE